MNGRKWMRLSFLTALSCLFMFGVARAQNTGPTRESDAAADERPGPNNPPRPNERGPGGPPNFGPPESRFDRSERRDVIDPSAPAPRRQPNGPAGMFGGTFGGMGGSMRPSDPEMEKLMDADFGLDRESRNLAAVFRQGTKSAQDEIKKKMHEVVTKQFEVRQELRTLQLKRLEDEIKRIRESIDKRNQAKPEKVDRRVSELLGEDDNSF